MLICILAFPLVHVVSPNVIAPSVVSSGIVSVVISFIALPTFPALSATSTFIV